MTFDHVREWKHEFESSGWWHSFELPDGSVLEGKCDLAGLKERLAVFPLPADLTGLRALDVGTWDGWFAFELAKRGAEVVAIDCWDNPRFREMRRLLGLESQVDYQLMNVYDVSPEALGRFDVVMFMGVLYHLKHPLLGLERVCSVTRDMACVDSFVLREPHTPNLEFEGRLVMEFFETDEFGGQTDNWVAPSASCLAAFCRTAGFARAELVGNLPYSASFACYRRWQPPQPEWGLEPRLIDAVHHVDYGSNFSTRRDDYIVAWFSVDSGHLGIKDIFPEVSGYGVRPIHVTREKSNWMVTFKLPPGLEAGWHEVRLRVKGSRLSTPVRIAVDLPLSTEAIRIATLADGATWKDNQVDLRVGNTLALWVIGLPESADRRSIRARVNGRPAEVSFVEPPGPVARQVNVLLPSDSPEETTVEIIMGTAKADARVRCLQA
jgi:tRNA (mo5U34)-methyltransferase